MTHHLRLLRRATALALVITMGACDRLEINTSKAPAPSASSPAPAGTQPQADAATTPRAQASGLPDFTVLVETQGPAVVNVVTTRSARSSAGNAVPDDPLFDFFRRFMPNPPADPGPEGRGQGLG